MSQGLSTLAPGAVDAALEDHLERRLAEVLRRRSEGHCMRVADLDPDLALSLTLRLQSAVSKANVVVLTDEESSAKPGHVTATKLVELRNPLPDGSLRPPLLVFVPNSVRTSAEDSFGVATFEAVSVAGAYEAIREQAINQLHADLQRSIRVVTDVLDADGWAWADDHAWVRYLLTVHQNGPDEEVAGAALYEFGLIPDREIFTRSGPPDSRVRHNIDTVRSLTYSDRPERARVLALPLTDQAFKSTLAARLVEIGLDNPAKWTREIVTDRTLWPYTFDKWPFEEATQPTDKVCIEVNGLDLPVLEEGKSKGREALVGQQVLTVGKGGLKKFGLGFHVDPRPSRVQGLSHFRIGIYAQDGAPTGISRRKSAWASKRSDTKLTFNNLNKIEWEEGWYFVRVLAFTKDEELIPIVDRLGNVVDWGGGFQAEQGKRPNDSDLFYVLPGEEADVEPPQRSVARHPSLTHALIELQAAAVNAGRAPSTVELRDIGWSEGRGRTMLDADLRFGRDGAVKVPIATVFKHLQQDAAAHASVLASWHIDVRDGIASSPTLTPLHLPSEGSYWQRLREARHEFLRAVGDIGAIEVASLIELRPFAMEYAQAYQRVLEVSTSDTENDQDQSSLLSLLRLDTISLSVSEKRGTQRSAVLIGPTHPFRALWLVSWGTLAEAWMEKAGTSSAEQVALTKDTLLQNLVATGHPLCLPAPDDNLYLPAQDLHPFWSLYVPHYELDPRGLSGIVARALGLPSADTSGGIDASFLAGRFRHYLRQRPYIRTLVVNAFNPGRATALAIALVELQKDPVYRDLRYDIRLFGPDPTSPSFGDVFNELIDPGGYTASEAADAFSTYGGNNRVPKLSVARVQIDEFHQAPDRYDANLTFLFDVFPPSPIRAEEAPDHETAPVHGLLATTRTHFLDTNGTVSWTRVLEAGDALPIPGTPNLAAVLTESIRTMARANAQLAAPDNAEVANRPALLLSLSPTDRALINRVHNISDWVVTLDRTLGVEFFDHGGFKNRPDFLIDHSPASEAAGGRHVVVTARSSAEVLNIIRNALNNRDLPAEAPAPQAIFDALRRLSPQLSLKLVSNPAQQAEALGLALAKLFLDRKGATKEQINVPLDSHLNFYGEVQAAADARGEAASLRRTDLALFDLRPGEKIITCNLVEVKAYGQIGGLGNYATLRESVAEQLYESEKALQLHFDPSRSNPDRPDRAYKAHQLRVILRYYLDRAVRFGVLSPRAAQESADLLAQLEDGYTLAFTRSAILFDFGAPGFDDKIHERGVDYYRIGKDLIEQLLQHATEATRGTLTKAELAEDPVPRLSTATFLAPRRRMAPSVGPETSSYEDSTSSTNDNISQHVSEPTPDLLTGEGIENSSIDMAVNPVNPSPNSSHSTRDRPSTDQPQDASLPLDSDSGQEVAIPSSPQASENSVTDQIAEYDVLLGVQRSAEQYGLLGETAGRKVALDLNHTHTISLFGVQGGGKSYTLGSIIEMAARPIPRINHLPQPLAVVLFHYSPTQDYRPEFTSMIEANAVAREVSLLRERYNAEPLPLPDVHLLVPPGKVDERREEYPHLPIHPLRFAANELQASHWSFLMGIAGNSSAYVKQLRLLMRDLRHDLSLPLLRQAIVDSHLPESLKQLARLRLNFAEPFVSDGEGVRSLVRPGRLLIVDLRDEFIEQDEALGLFSVLLQLASDADSSDDETFNKLVVFDEAHKYTKNAELVEGLVGTVREMRHKGTSVLVASQDPPSIPTPLIELSSQIILHKFNSPAWLKHIQKANAALGQLTPEMMTALGPGEAYVWSSKATDKYVTHHAVKVSCRPRVTQHGGSTRTAVQ